MSGHPGNQKKRHVTGHPNRFQSSSKKVCGGSNAKSKVLSYVLYPEDLDARDKYRVNHML